MEKIKTKIIEDCIKLLSFADDSAKALASEDERGLLRFYEGRSQARVLKILSELIDDLGQCRTVDDLPGPCDEVTELRNVSLEVFRGLAERVGNPFGLTLRFRAEAVEFFRGLLTRDPLLLARVRNRRERELVRSLLTCALKVTPLILRGRTTANAIFSHLPISLGLMPRMSPISVRRKRRHVEDGEWMRIERSEVLRWANSKKNNPKGKLPHELARAVWRANKADFVPAARFSAEKRGYKDDKSLRAHFYPLRDKFIRQRTDGKPFAE